MTSPTATQVVPRAIRPVPKAGQAVGRGFSLIEVLVAVVIMSLGLLSLASLQMALIRSGSEAKAQTLAMAVAKQKIERLASVQALGGADSNCVSPTDWVLAGPPSCYRAIRDEPATNFDGDPALGGTQPLGGVEFRVATQVTRLVFDVSRSVYDVVGDTALDAALVTSVPETFLPGKEFKRILVTVTWTDASGAQAQVQVEDAISGIVPRDSIALLTNRRNTAGRKAESIIVNPATVAGTIPIAVGYESSSAASNPTPELLGGSRNTYVAETRFAVYTYLPLDDATALAQSRVETAVVGCRCDTATASTLETSLRPTYWNGVQYVVPTAASYPPIAGPKAVGSAELPQSDQCRVCCRDHHDPTGTDSNGDVLSAIALFSPRRASHSHFLVDESTGLRVAADSGPYSEVCRMIRVNGQFRVAADFNNDYFALLPARNAGLSPFAPTPDVADDYADMVKKYLAERITEETDNTRYNDSHNAATPAGPDPADFETGSRLASDGVTTRNYDLNLPAQYFLALSQDSKWLHARGLYIDYLTPEAIARIDAAKTDCPTQPATNDCVLPFLPFTSINLSEIAEWKDVAINPANAASGQVVSVMNNGFKTATGDEQLVENGASGVGGTQVVSFVSAISDKVVAGMSVAGPGIADGARVTAVANNLRSVTVDKPNTGAVGASVTFEGAPVRGLASSGTAPASGNTALARTTASYNNAAIALRFPINNDEGVLTDSQRFELSATGGPPDPTAGTFTVIGFTDSGGVLYPFGTPFPIVEWGIGASGLFSIDPCTRQGNPLPYLCAPSSGLGGPMRIRVSGYNVKLNVTESFTGSCRKPNGAMVTATGSTTRPYCKNYDVISASTATASGITPYGVSNPGKSAESTEIGFSVLNNNDVITLGIEPNGETAGSFVSCTANGSGALGTVTWTDPCL